MQYLRNAALLCLLNLAAVQASATVTSRASLNEEKLRKDGPEKAAKETSSEVVAEKKHETSTAEKAVQKTLMMTSDQAGVHKATKADKRKEDKSETVEQTTQNVKNQEKKETAPQKDKETPEKVKEASNTKTDNAEKAKKREHVRKAPEIEKVEVDIADVKRPAKETKHARKPNKIEKVEVDVADVKGSDEAHKAFQKKDEDSGAKEQGVSGKIVEHDDGKTATQDWRSEYGRTDRSYEDICKDYPTNPWCKKHLRKTTRKTTIPKTQKSMATRNPASLLALVISMSAALAACF